MPLDGTNNTLDEHKLHELLGLMVTELGAAQNAALVILGTVLQVTGLIRARAVPAWVWAGLLFSIITLLVPAEGLLGLVTGIPMAAGAIGLGYFAVRRVSATA